MHASATIESLFLNSVRGLRQPLMLWVLFTAMLVPLFGYLGDWAAGFSYGAIPFLVLAAFAGPLAVAAARRRYRFPLLSGTTLMAALFASAWACLWLIPFNLLIFLRHGHFLSASDNSAGLAAVATSAFLLSFLPGES
ncbi:hypothetical protein [Xanthomonas arboricola]|uniref:hypothetical protein n=1 Tax=Xanthomonas arboricola TaxID=56448 RepID=UPI004040A15C